MTAKVRALEPNKQYQQSAKEILERALAEEPDEVLVVVFSKGSYRLMGSKTLSTLQQVGCLESIKQQLLADS